MLLEISDLRVSYPGRTGRPVPVLRGVTLSIARGEVVGLLGESGCGKSTTALAIPAALPAGSAVSGSIRFRGRELVSATDAEMRALRGAEFSIIFQEPRLAVHPTMRVGDQIGEVLRAHDNYRTTTRKSKVLEVMSKIGLDRALYDAYPHEMSGGELQRVCIAQAIACDPSLIIADEPTASLDTITQAEILSVFADLKIRSRAGMLFISHHPAILRGLADRICVMYAGEIVEEGSAKQVLTRPLHPYTDALLQAVPPPAGTAVTKRLAAIPGDHVRFDALPSGCAFSPRCASSRAVCGEQPIRYSAPFASSRVRCVLYEH